MILLLAILLALLVLPSPWGWIVVIVAAILEVLETGAFLWWSNRRRRLTRPAVGVEDLVGRSGVVVTPLRPEGQVRLFGELWRARGAPEAAPGARVVVRGVDRMVLEVEAEE